MLLKLVHYLVLLCYVNILAYEVSAGGPVVVSDPLLNGESILEFVLDDVLEIPIDKESADVQIMYDEYRIVFGQYHILPLFIVLTGLFLSFRLLSACVKHPKYDGKKRQIVLGYYSHLYRLKPF